MQIIPLEIESLKEIVPTLLSDQRGFFTRVYCRDLFAQAGIDFEVVQMNISGNHALHTLRGMHFQVAPALEAKLVRCSAGRVLDIIVDVRPGSPTYLKHAMVELSAEKKNAVYIPPMCAHGYLTLTPGAEVTYATSAPYTPACERGLRHDDPALGIRLPYKAQVISDKDRAWPLL